MDYPDEETTIKRFEYQGVLNSSQIKNAIYNTNVTVDFCDYDKISVFMTDIKLPTLYPDKSQKEKNKIYSKLITEKFKQYIKNVPANRKKEYLDGIKKEVQTYKDTNMVDYPLLDYEIVKEAVSNGGIITNTGRGSATGFMTNTLCGLSKVDRFTAPIKLYPERFISTSRILETKSLPDIDLNVGTVEIFEEAQKKVLGEEHVAPMIAFGTFKKKSAFKLYARAEKMDFDLANKISDQIGKYEEALRYASDNDKDDIRIENYVDEEYLPYYEKSKVYWGIVSDRKKAPSAYLLYQGNVRKEIGLIKCKSESTKKECITTVMDGGVAEKYKFLKNDILKVDSALLIHSVFDRIGIDDFDVNTLLELTKDDKKTWDIYGNGLTVGVNQVETPSTISKIKKYKPKNISELSAFVAAIRPSFKSMYKKLENREYFEYGIPALDKLLQTKELPTSYILFQEQIMNVLNYAGFPIDKCYGILKDIAKKHPEKVKPLKKQFIEGFKNKLINEENLSESEAKETTDKVWQIVNDSCNYGFNSSHAYCMALDSLYQAWQKSNYPYEFYEVLLQLFSDKGKKDKVSLLKNEMYRGFGIKEGSYKFGIDNRKFKADKKNHCIYPSLLSIKKLSQSCANDLYVLGKNKDLDSFYKVLKAMEKKKSLNSSKITTLIQIGYFSDFAGIEKIEAFMEAYNVLYKRTQFLKYSLPLGYADIIKKYSEETEKQYRHFDYDKALEEIWDSLEESEISISKKIKYELNNFGYIRSTFPQMSDDIFYCQNFECKFKNPKLELYRLNDGEIITVKVRKKLYDNSPIYVNDMIRVKDFKKEGKWSKDNNGEWQQSKKEKEIVLKSWNFIR